MGSGLFYHDTRQEVLLGDRVELRTLLGRRRRGKVTYLPRKTGRELQAERKPPDSWLVTLENGTVTGWIYSPEDLQPPPRLRLLTRGPRDFRSVSPDELERQEQAEERGSWVQYLGCLLLAALFGLALVAARVLVRRYL